MAAPNRNKLERERDRKAIAQMVLRGMTVTDIAKELTLSIQMVSYDKKVIEKQWREERFDDTELYISKELKQLEYLYRQALLGWERSITSKDSAKKTTNTQKIKMQGGETSVEQPATLIKETVHQSKETLVGDAHFLEVAKGLREDIRKLLNINSPVKIEISEKMPRTIKEAREELEKVMAALKLKPVPFEQMEKINEYLKDKNIKLGMN